MKPAAFEYVRARSISETTQLLAESPGAQVIAGGQSLGPLLNLRLAQPDLLLDIAGIPEMSRVDDEDDAITLGACITTANIEDGRFPNRGLQILRAVASRIAYRAVRNRGTIGGSLCHADPASDWVSALGALGAVCQITGPNGSRLLPIEGFVIGAYQTELRPGELLEAIRIPRISPAGRWGFYKLCRRTGEFASSIAAVLHDPANDRYRMVIGATDGRPIVLGKDRVPWEVGNSSKALVLDQSALPAILTQAGIDDPIARRWHTVVLQRAFKQAQQS